MPIQPRPVDVGPWSAPRYHFHAVWTPGKIQPSAGLFHESMRNLAGYLPSLFALLALLGLMAFSGVWSVRRLARGDPLHVMLWAQAIAGWFLYTWFNPIEPFLWSLEFVPLWVVSMAEALRPRGSVTWAIAGVATFLLAVHNTFAFFLSFR
jgi:hypothetical protein